MISATRAPTAIAATKPSATLPVVNATAKPAIAASISEPSSERLMTPAFSLIVSPTAANTSGAESARIDASKRMTMSMGTLRLRVGIGLPCAHPANQYDDEDQDALNDAAQGRIQLQLHLQGAAAERQGCKHEANRSHPDGAEAGQHRYENGKVAVSAADGWNQPVIGHRRLHRAGKPGACAGQCERRQHLPFSRDAE